VKILVPGRAWVEIEELALEKMREDERDTIEKASDPFVGARTAAIRPHQALSYVL